MIKICLVSLWTLVCARSDSTIVAPYERWQLHQEDTSSLPLLRYSILSSPRVLGFISQYSTPLNISNWVIQTQYPHHRNYAANKTKQVAWFVSNCGAR